MKHIETILSLTHIVTSDLRPRVRVTHQGSRDGSLRGLASEVLGSEEQARRWLGRCDALELPILNSYLLRRARSSKVNNQHFMEAAAAVWA
ncbi:hypothetical protein ACO2Q9_13945 [Variovorax sp. VNK109]|jgi:hypothetical protein|uniref:hypothetical protein n=1 Tax=Variovorax sp. VNK109 TaxID=3400919 RepID=UPI003BFDEC3F